MGVDAGLYMYDVVVKSSRSLSHLLMSFFCIERPSPASAVVPCATVHGYFLVTTANNLQGFPITAVISLSGYSASRPILAECPLALGSVHTTRVHRRPARVSFWTPVFTGRAHGHQSTLSVKTVRVDRPCSRVCTKASFDHP